MCRKSPLFTIATRHHICHQRHETALSYSYPWSCINPTMLSSVVIAEILAWAKTAPLHSTPGLPIGTTKSWTFARVNLRLISPGSVTSAFLDDSRLLEQLVSPALTLEFLTLPDISPHSYVPDALFNGTFPKLTSLKLNAVTSAGSHLSSRACDPSRY